MCMRVGKDILLVVVRSLIMSPLFGSLDVAFTRLPRLDTEHSNCIIEISEWVGNEYDSDCTIHMWFVSRCQMVLLQ